MFNRLGVLSSDMLNRDGYVIAFEVLEKMVAENAINGMPQLIDHDFHRPLGWIIPFGILIEPKLSRSVGNFYYSETDEDIRHITPKIDEHWRRLNYEACQPHIDEFKTLLKSNFSSEGTLIEKGAVAYYLKDVTSKVFPNLFSSSDKSGLVYLNDILEEFVYVGCGIFKSRNSEFCIFCHQYFKRSLSLLNNYNTYFIDEFITLSKEKDIVCRIAIDRNLIGLSKTITGTLEFDYWWGPKFNNDVSSLPDGVTRYESNDEQKFFSSVIGTEFWWKTNNHEKTLEIEEVREKPSLGADEGSFGCRYIHSIYDTDTDEFIHFDGAIRMYSEEQILERWDVNINKAGKNTDYTKLFRIDGKLQLADWKKLCILYYKGNPLVFEYFGAKNEYDNLRSSEKGVPVSKIAQLAPYVINSDDGIRIFASYFKKKTDYKTFERKLVNPDIIQFQNGKIIEVLEYDIIEIEKHIRRAGGSLKYPDKVSFIKPFDFHTNYPIILHGSNNTEQLVTTTLNAYRSILEIQNLKLNKTICFTIAWEMVEFEVRLSVFGKSSEIVKWLKENQNIPVDYLRFSKWLSQQRKWIYENYEYKQNDFLHLVQEDGAFFIKRTRVDPEMIKFPDRKDENYFEVDVGNDHELAELIREKKVFPSFLGLLKKITCTRTGENYLTSSTSKYLDDGVNMAIEQIDLLDVFWTDEEYR